jgi:homoserine O-acetyltransferase
MRTTLEANITMMNQGISIWRDRSPFTTESGFTFPHLDIAYKTWGTLNAARDNAVLVFHALTGHAAADEWFPGIFDNHGFVATHRPFVLCMNVAGSCYGSTGPLSVNPETGLPYLNDFPVLTIRDFVRMQQRLVDHLGITGIQMTLGASMGGMQALEWAVMDNRVKRAVVIAVGKAHSAWQIGISEAQRQAIYADPKWNNGKIDPLDGPASGLAAARMMGMMLYRSRDSFERRFGRNMQDGKPGVYQMESYLHHQGKKLVDRMNALTYVRLTQAMDSYDIGRGRGGVEAALHHLDIPVLAVGISSDVLYPVSEQKELAALCKNGRYAELTSDNGHDAFLIEFDTLNTIFSGFLIETGFPLPDTFSQS